MTFKPRLWQPIRNLLASQAFSREDVKHIVHEAAERTYRAYRMGARKSCKSGDGIAVTLAPEVERELDTMFYETKLVLMNHFVMEIIRERDPNVWKAYLAWFGGGVGIDDRSRVVASDDAHPVGDTPSD